MDGVDLMARQCFLHTRTGPTWPTEPILMEIIHLCAPEAAEYMAQSGARGGIESYNSTTLRRIAAHRILCMERESSSKHYAVWANCLMTVSNFCRAK